MWVISLVDKEEPQPKCKWAEAKHNISCKRRNPGNINLKTSRNPICYDKIRNETPLKEPLCILNVQSS